jgi:hypothetical protein
MRGVTASGSGLVAVGSTGSEETADAAVWTSPDGATWLRVPHNDAAFGGKGDQGMIDVTVGGPGLVTVGWDYPDTPDPEPNAAVWTSPDGDTWSRVTHDEALFGGEGWQSMTSVTEHESCLVAVGYDGPLLDIDAAVWTSVDGFAWSRVPHDESVFGGEGDQRMFDIVAGGPGLVAVGSGARNAAVWESTTEP